VSSEETDFLNVDLEITTRGEIAPLLEHWSKKVVVLRNSVDGAQRTVWLELGIENPEMDRVLRSLLDLIDSLPRPLRTLWDQCDERCFNIGIQGGGSPHFSVFSISTETLHRVSAVHARVDFTVYAVASNPTANG
jgi:hypothetical protein